ncbi:MAG: hypothetical protein AB8C84_08665 [Oligoflexales bacterium]
MDFRAVILSRWMVPFITIGLGGAACAPSAEDQTSGASRTPIEQRDSTYDSSKSDESLEVGGSSTDHESDDILIPQPISGSWLSCASLGEGEAQCEVEDEDIERIKDIEGDIQWVAMWDDGRELSKDVAEHIEFNVSEDGLMVSFSFGDLDKDIQEKIVIELMKGSVLAGRSPAFSELPKVVLGDDEPSVSSSSSYIEDDVVCENGSNPDLRGRWLVCLSGWDSGLCPGGQKAQSNQYCPVTK